jgi:hypothetical protein
MSSSALVIAASWKPRTTDEVAGAILTGVVGRFRRALARSWRGAALVASRR